MSHSHGASIEDYLLVRQPAVEEPICFKKMMDLMGAEHKERHYWTDFELSWGARRMCEYTVSVANHAYIVSQIDTLLLSLPRMKHRDMIVDNYKDAGGDLATLEKIGVSFITNPDARDCIEEAFKARQEVFPATGWRVIELPFFPLPKDGEAVIRTLTYINSERNSPGWLELTTGNPFLEGQQKMLREYQREFAGAVIARVTVAVQKKPESVNMHALYMITHLTRSDPPPRSEDQPLLEHSVEYVRRYPRDLPAFDWNFDRE
ncbi:hypothetical protein F5Y05DRAFT_415134 [Hypoxylon sp. FL0543]|nr:hypothetical protein F5Y05DRAFT_415134 [Hypoxylon sp. FL0543]